MHFCLYRTIAVFFYQSQYLLKIKNYILFKTTPVPILFTCIQVFLKIVMDLNIIRNIKIHDIYRYINTH